MPKMKTKRAAAKRFKVTGTGKIKRFKAYKRHILTKKSTGQAGLAQGCSLRIRIRDFVIFQVMRSGIDTEFQEK